MILRLEGNFDDDARDVSALVQSLASVLHDSSPKSYKIDAKNCRYLGPWSASILGAERLARDHFGRQLRLILPTDPPALQAFCTFSGLSHLFRGGPSPDPDHPDCETVPLTQIRDANWNCSDGVIRLLKRHMLLGRDSEDQVRTCIQEVVQNVVDHSRSPIGDVLCARYISSRAEVRVGIVDRGLGIAATLSPAHPGIRSATHALERVLRGGLSSRSRPNNQGLGISNLYSLVQLAAGRMAILSGNGFASIMPDRPPELRELSCGYPGTAVLFSLPVVERSTSDPDDDAVRDHPSP